MSKIDLSVAGKYFRNLYTDKLKVIREEEVASELGDIKIEKVVLYEDIECRADPWTTDDDPNTSRYEEDHQILPILIFCSGTLDIMKGDWLEVTRMFGDTPRIVYRGYANAPQIYPSHQEIKIEVKQQDV